MQNNYYPTSGELDIISELRIWTRQKWYNMATNPLAGLSRYINVNYDEQNQTSDTLFGILQKEQIEKY